MIRNKKSKAKLAVLRHEKTVKITGKEMYQNRLKTSQKSLKRVLGVLIEPSIRSAKKQAIQSSITDKELHKIHVLEHKSKYPNRNLYETQECLLGKQSRWDIARETVNSLRKRRRIIYREVFGYLSKQEERQLRKEFKKEKFKQYLERQAEAARKNYVPLTEKDFQLVNEKKSHLADKQTRRQERKNKVFTKEQRQKSIYKYLSVKQREKEAVLEMRILQKLARETGMNKKERAIKTLEKELQKAA